MKKLKQTLHITLSGLLPGTSRIKHNSKQSDTSTLQRRPQACSYSVCQAALIY